MSSLVYKKAAAAAVDANKTPAESVQQSQKQQNPSPINKKGLSRRSVSFEKFLVTAFHIRLACKCTWELSIIIN